MQMHVKIPLRDGVHLNATLFRPAGAVTPLPVIFKLTPYPDDALDANGYTFANSGFVFAYVDVRGRGDSEGLFDPLATDGQDGYDVTEWLARQPFSNGRVGMYGFSYDGANQWQVAGQHPPHLVAIAPGSSVRPGVDFPFTHNIPLTYNLTWLALTSGRTLYAALYDAGQIWHDAALRLYLDKAPFQQFDTYAGVPDTAFQRWIAHPDFDEFWQQRTLARAQVAAVALPTLAVTGGQRDGDQAGTLSFYADRMSSTNPNIRDTNYLVIGPWNHFDTRDPKQNYGGQHYEPAATIDMLRLYREWYAFTLKGAPRPAFLQKNVIYYVTGSGAECWKSADTLAATSSHSAQYFLDATGGAMSIAHPGLLAQKQSNVAPATFVSDPNDLSAATPVPGPPGADLHGDGLAFDSAPIATDFETAGRWDLKLWLSIDAPDTDLSAALFAIGPDGKTSLVATSLLRARYRNSPTRPQAIHEGQPELYDFSGDTWTATRFSKGSHFRLFVAALNSLNYEKNWNSMKPVAEQSGADARVAHITLLQTREHPSSLSVPLGDVAAACRASADW